jgi:thiamine kinase
MLPRELEAIALRWVPGAGPVAVEPLSAGLVNESFRVLRGGRRYSLRVATGEPRELGLDRQWECRVLREAAATGLTPRIECCEPAAGVLVAGWIDGRTWSPAETLAEDAIRAMAQLLRRVHALTIPQPARAMHPAAWIDHYAMASARLGTGVALRSNPLREEASARLARLAEIEPAEPVLCHSDLHRFNVAVVDQPRSVVLLDWEYVHVSDAYWDLAGWVSNNDWDGDAAEGLLSAYLERPALGVEMERLRQWAWLYDFVCLMWSELYFSQERDAGAARDGVVTRADVLAARLRG